MLEDSSHERKSDSEILDNREIYDRRDHDDDDEIAALLAARPMTPEELELEQRRELELEREKNKRYQNLEVRLAYTRQKIREMRIGLVPSPGKLVQVLNKKSANFAHVMERLRRNYGKSHQKRNELTRGSKEALEAVELQLFLANPGEKGQVEDLLSEYRKELKVLWCQVRSIELPEDLEWGFDSEGGQEYGEFFLVDVFFNYLYKGQAVEEISSIIPSSYDLGISKQSWLAALGDAVSELGKMNKTYLTRNKMSRQERIETMERFLDFAGQIWLFLRQFYTCYGYIINNSRRRGFRNTFRGVVENVKWILDQNQNDLIRMINDNSK